MIDPQHLPMLRTASMNDTHFEAILLINKLSESIEQADVDEINRAFDALIEHTEAHYENEEAMMVEKGFPPYPAHKEEHDDSLQAMQNTAKQFREHEDVAAVKTYMEQEFIPFFLRHTETMDQVTSLFLENSEAHLPFWERLVPRKQK